MQFLFHVPRFQIMIINAMQGKSKAFKSLTPSYICIIICQIQKFVTAFNIAGAQVFVLIGRNYEVYEVKFADLTKNTAFSKLPQHFLKTRDVLMLIPMSSPYPCRHRHHRNPLNETF